MTVEPSAQGERGERMRRKLEKLEYSRAAPYDEDNSRFDEIFSTLTYCLPRRDEAYVTRIKKKSGRPPVNLRAGNVYLGVIIGISEINNRTASGLTFNVLAVINRARVNYYRKPEKERERERAPRWATRGKREEEREEARYRELGRELELA